LLEITTWPALAGPTAARTLSASSPGNDAESLAVLAAAAPLSGGAEALGRRAAPAASLVLVAEARVAGARSVVALRHDLALVDPALHADHAEGRLRLRLAVVDVGADRVQRHTSLRVHLAPAHLAAAEPSTRGDLDPLGARPHRRGQRALHGAAEAHPVLEL